MIMRGQKRSINRVLITAIAAVLLGIMMVMPAFAKTTTVKPKSMYIKAGVQDSTIIKKAAKVKAGTTKVMLPSKKGTCVLKFTATKSKTYTFTFSGLKPTSDSNISLGFFSFLTRVTPGVDKLKMVPANTKNGSQTIVQYGSSNMYAAYPTSNYGKIKLNKGDTVFVYVAASHGKSINCKIK